MKIGAKLTLSYAAMLASLLLITAASVVSIQTISARLEGLYIRFLPAIDALDQADRDLYQLMEAERSILLFDAADPRAAKYKAAYTENLQQSAERVAKAAALAATETERNLYDEHNRARKDWEGVSARVLELASRGDLGGALALSVGDAASRFGVMRETLNSLQEILNEEAERYSMEAVDAQNRALLFVVGVSFAALVLAVVLAMVITRSISIPLRSGVSVADSIARGDLSVRAPRSLLGRKDETGDLIRSLETMKDSLLSIVERIKSASRNLSSGSRQINDTAQSLSQGATQQAASAQEVAASVEEMSSTIKQNAENASQTEAMAQKSSRGADEGGLSVNETVQAMREIAGRIGVVEEIARQTNLLALNAAIEAARAGEAGKGFAVVASEVRKLAERSQGASKEIGELSSRSIGVAEKAGASINGIVPDIKKTATLIQEIAAASREQSAGADQIGKAMSQLDEIIQRTAAASEELASMAEEFNGQSDSLLEAVSFFRLGAGEALPAPGGVESRPEPVPGVLAVG